MPTAVDLLHRHLPLAHAAATALTAHGWRVTPSAAHSGGTADVAAERRWIRGKLTARVRLIVRCEAANERFALPTLDTAAGDPLPTYSLGDDDPAQRRSLAAVIDAALIEHLHALAYPHEMAVTLPAHIDALAARARAAAPRDPAVDEAFISVDAVRHDLLQHDLDGLRDDMEIDADCAATLILDGAHRCELVYPIVLTGAELWSFPAMRRCHWMRLERLTLVGHQRQWIDIVEAEAFASYAAALTRHITATYRKRRFAPADASSRS